MCGKNFQIYGVHIPRKCIDLGYFYSCSSPLKTRTQVLVITPYAEGIYLFPRQHSFENLFPPTVEKGGENYDLIYQNSARKNEDDLDH